VKPTEIESIDNLLAAIQQEDRREIFMSVEDWLPRLIERTQWSVQTSSHFVLIYHCAPGAIEPIDKGGILRRCQQYRDEILEFPEIGEKSIAAGVGCR
jgi:hypothetical protein